MKVLTVSINGFTYRFADLIKVGEHYLGHQVRDDNTIGKMEHRITQKEYDSGTMIEVELPN